MKLTKDEIGFLIELVKAEKGIIGFLSGFKRMTQEQISNKEFLDNLIKKLKSLC